MAEETSTESNEIQNVHEEPERPLNIFSLDTYVTELDEKEFNLPIVDTTPTLESILNEPDDIPGLDEGPIFVDQGETGSLTSDSLSGRCSTSANDQSTPNRQNTSSPGQTNSTSPVHDSILRHVVLRGISLQLVSAGDRVGAGVPSAMTVSALIAIGTTHGLVLVFDPKQALKWCLGSVTTAEHEGAVSALAMNTDCTRLLAGFAHGQITMWDLTNGKELRVIIDAHPPGTAVLHIQFTDDPTVALFSDSGGSVFELNFKRLMGVRSCDSTCIFLAGEVCTFASLCGGLLRDHPLEDLSLIAMVTMSKVIVVTIRPKLRILFHHPLKGDVSALPLVTWHYVIIQYASKKMLEPVLAFGRNNVIYFFQVLCQTADDIRFQPLQKMILPYTLLSILWVNAKTLVTLDTTEKFHVIDIKSEKELECLDIGDVKLVYGSSHFKSLATGGNVSPAMSLAGESACYESYGVFRGQMILLGTKSIHVFTLRSWQERIDYLTKQEKHKDALALALSFYQDKAKAVVGLTRNVPKRRETVSNKLLEVLQEFVELSVTTHVPARGPIHFLTEHYMKVIPVCIDYCLAIDRLDILFGRIYERFSSDTISKCVFLECLEPYILDDKLPKITPMVMQDLVENYENKGAVADLENVIVHLDVLSMDIDHMVRFCRKHCMYDGIIYIFTQGMKDYISPLEELMDKMKEPVLANKSLNDNIIHLGNTVLVYISCCLAGRAYPTGVIPEFMVLQVKMTVIKTLTCLHTNKPEGEPVYPYLRTLLHYSAHEFLNALSLAFDEPEFNTEDGQQQKQRIVDILLQIMVNSTEFSPTQVGALFTFLARQMAKSGNTIFVSRLLFEQVLEYLSNPADESRHEEREQALLELLHAAGIQQFDEEKLLALAETAEFYRVCELMYDKRREYDKMLRCYLKDTSRQLQVFHFVEHVVSMGGYTDKEKELVQKETFSNIETLLKIDNKQTAQLILSSFPDHVNEVLDTFASKPQLKYSFLQGVFEYREYQGSGKDAALDPKIMESYLELMCQFYPAEVCSHLKSTEGYKTDQALQICRQYKCMDAVAYLLEKSGDMTGAFNILLDCLREKVKSLQKILIGHDGGRTTAEQVFIAWSVVQASLFVVVQLCQRTSTKVNEKEREAIWFSVLEVLMEPQRALKQQLSAEDLEAFKEVTRHVLNSMLGHVSASVILQRIIEDPTYNMGKLGEIKELVLGMLESFNYEKTLLKTTNNLLHQDLHGHLFNLQRAVNRGYTATSEECSLCHKLLSNISDADNVVIFRCFHSYHAPCLKSMCSYVIIDNTELYECWHCSRKPSNPITLGRARIRSPSSQLADVVPTRAKNQPDHMQQQALHHLRKTQKKVSRLAVLNELAHPEQHSKTMSGAGHSNSILQREDFQLKLNVPPLEN